VSKATLYQHFPSKEELAIRVITSAMQHGVTEMDTQDPALPAIDRLRAALFRSIRWRAGMWAAQIVLPSHVKRHPDFAAHRTRMLEGLATLVDEAKSQGDVRTDIPTSVVVRSLMMFYHMDFTELLVDGTLTADEVSRQIVSLALDGCAPSRNPNNP